MKKLFIIISFLSPALFMGCKSTDDSRNPTEVFTSFADAMIRKDMVRAKELCTPESQTILNMMEMTGIKNEKLLQKFDKNKVEFGTAIINGDNAKVPLKEKASGEIINFPMRKVNSQWRVSLDMGSMVEMAQDKFRNKTEGIRDTLNKARNVLKKINVDSMKTRINKMLDSVKFKIP